MFKLRGEQYEHNINNYLGERELVKHCCPLLVNVYSQQLFCQLDETVDEVIKSHNDIPDSHLAALTPMSILIEAGILSSPVWSLREKKTRQNIYTD